MDTFNSTFQFSADIPDLRDLDAARDILDLAERALVRLLTALNTPYIQPDLSSVDRVSRLLYCLVSIRRALIQLGADLAALPASVLAPAIASSNHPAPHPTAPGGRLGAPTLPPLDDLDSVRRLLALSETTLLRCLRAEVDIPAPPTLPTIEYAVRCLWRVVAVRRSIVRILMGLDPDPYAISEFAFPSDDDPDNPQNDPDLDPESCSDAVRINSMITDLEAKVSRAHSAAPDPDPDPERDPEPASAPDPEPAAPSRRTLPESPEVLNIPPVPGCGLVPAYRGDLDRAFLPIDQLKTQIDPSPAEPIQPRRDPAPPPAPCKAPTSDESPILPTEPYFPTDFSDTPPVTIIIPAQTLRPADPINDS